MSNFLKILAVALTLVSTNLQAQQNNTEESLPGIMLNESIAAFQIADSEAFGELFMKKAELIDASGTVIVGRAAIVQWHQGLLKGSAEAPAIQREVLSRHLRLLRPDLAVVVATTRISSGQQSEMVAYNCLFCRIDGKWYVETCAIVSVQATSPILTAANNN